MNSDSLLADLPAAVIKDGVSDAMIGQKEEASDSNPWENVDHKDGSSGSITRRSHGNTDVWGQLEHIRPSRGLQVAMGKVETLIPGSVMKSRCVLLL